MGKAVRIGSLKFTFSSTTMDTATRSVASSVAVVWAWNKFSSWTTISLVISDAETNTRLPA